MATNDDRGGETGTLGKRGEAAEGGREGEIDDCVLMSASPRLAFQAPMFSLALPLSSHSRPVCFAWFCWMGSVTMVVMVMADRLRCFKRCSGVCLLGASAQPAAAAAAAAVAVAALWMLTALLHTDCSDSALMAALSRRGETERVWAADRRRNGL